MDDEIRVMIADDHPLMRKGLRLSIDEDPGLKVVGEAADGEMALSLVTKLQPHVALLDIEMPKLDGLGVAREMIKRGTKDGDHLSYFSFEPGPLSQRNGYWEQRLHPEG